MTIRTEEKRDYNRIYDLVKEAFKTSLFYEGGEEDFVVEQRKRPTYIQELCLVAEINHEIVGHIMIGKTYIQSESASVQTLMISPLCVDQKYRCMGIGAQLVKTGINRAIEMGFKSICVCGNPKYYGRFGFKSVANFNITHNSTYLADENVMALELVPCELSNCSGTLQID